MSDKQDRTPQEREADAVFDAFRSLNSLWERLDRRREDHILWASAADYVSMAQERLEQAEHQLRRDFSKVQP